MRCCRENTEICLFLDVEHVANLLCKHSPLVVSEVVYHDEEHLFAAGEQRENLLFEDVWTHCGAVSRLHRFGVYPFEIVVLYEFHETVVGFLLLHLQHLVHVALGAGQFQFPAHQQFINVCPIVSGAAVGYLHRDVLEVLLVTTLGHLCHYLPLVDVLLQSEQYLDGVDRLDEIVGDFRADSLVHDVLLLALGDHHDRGCRLNLFQFLKCFKSANARHHLVEQNEVKSALVALVDGIGAVSHRHHLISFLLKEHDVRTKKLYLVINPK